MVKSSQEVKFYVNMAICDGAQANRAFIALHFESEEDAIASMITTMNPYSGEPHSFLMDPSVSTVAKRRHIPIVGLHDVFLIG